MPGNTVRIGTQVTGVGKASSDLDRLRDKFDKLQKQGAKGFAIGAGAAITTAGLNLMGSAIGSVTELLKGSVEQAIADEESVSRLGASLKANVPAWDGSTAAIERRIKAAQRLGFADEDLRASLTLLVGATHDVGKAQEIQNTAMDLARFKNISLQDATEALTRVEAGSYRILKSLGIVLKAGATQTEALAAVQKVAANQAADYADTTRGKLLAAQVALNEAMEKLGKATLPAVAGAASGAADAADSLGTALEVLTGKAPVTAEGLAAVAQGVLDIGANVPMLGAGMKAGANAIRQFQADAVSDANRTANAIATANQVAASRIGHALTGIGDASKDAGRVVGKSLSGIADDLDALWAHAAGAADQAAEDIFGPIERRAALAANTLAQSAAKGEIAKPRQKGETGLDVSQRVEGARADLLGLQKDFFTLTAEMGARGELTAKELARIREALKDELKGAAAEEAVSLLALMALLDRVAAKAKGLFGVGLGKGGLGTSVPNATPWPKTHAGGLLGMTSGATDLGVAGEAGSEAVAIIRNPKPIRATEGSAVGGMTDPAILNALNIQTAYLARIAAGEPAAARPMTARGDLARQSALMPGGRL